MKFDNKEGFLSYIKQSLEDGDFDSQIKQISQDDRIIKKSKKNWDWMKFGKTYLVTNRGNDLFFIYYGNQEGSFMWIAQNMMKNRLLNDYSNIWNMNSNGGECWVTSHLEINLRNNFFLNWDKEPWSDLK